MPKTTLILVVPNLDGSPSSPKSRYIFKESQITFHSELINLLHHILIRIKRIYNSL